MVYVIIGMSTHPTLEPTAPEGRHMSEDRTSGNPSDAKVAFITGVARGQGRSHALHFARAGVAVIGLDICGQVDSVDYPMSSELDLADTVAEVEAAGGRILARVGDVRNLDDVESALRDGVAAFGRLDYVVANAGIMPIWGRYANTMQSWQDCLDVILTGVLNTIEASYPILVEQGAGGSIVITGSMAAVQPMMRTLDGHTLGLLGYSAAKAALVNLSENYASALAGHGIRVNIVHPTGVATPMIENDMCRSRFDNANPEDLKTIVNALPTDKVQPRDVSELVVWLCSDRSRYLTGGAIRVDAGAKLR